MLGIACHDEGDSRQALEYAGFARTLSEDLGDADMTVQTEALIAMIHYGYGEYHTAQRLIRECERKARSLQGRRALGWVLIYRAAAESALGHYQQAAEFAHEALDLSKSMKLPGLAASAKLRLGDVSLFSGDYASAARRYLDALSIAESEGDAHERCHAIGGLAEVYYLEGITDMCVGCALRAEDLGQSILLSGTVLSARAHRAAANARTGSFREAKELLLECLRDAQKQNSFDIQLTVKRLFGEVLLRYGPSAEEQDRGRRILESASTQAVDCDLAHEVRRLQTLLNLNAGPKSGVTHRVSSASE